MRISCWTNQLHLIHGKPVGSKLPTVGSSYCFLIVCPSPPSPLPRHSAIAHAILVPLYNYIKLNEAQVDYPADTFAIQKTTELKEQNSDIKSGIFKDVLGQCNLCCNPFILLPALCLFVLYSANFLQFPTI